MQIKSSCKRFFGNNFGSVGWKEFPFNYIIRGANIIGCGDTVWIHTSDRHICIELLLIFFIKKIWCCISDPLNLLYLVQKEFSGILMLVSPHLFLAVLACIVITGIMLCRISTFFVVNKVVRLDTSAFYY